MTPRIFAGLAAGGIGVGLVAAHHLPAPDLVVLCSNNVESCISVIDAYEKRTGADVTVVRMPTSEALARVRLPKEAGEFDVWMGGPADAYITAADEGLLASADVDATNIPADLRDPHGRWYGIYGGILAFCSAGGIDAPQTWGELVEDGRRVVIPNPMTSGTAFTMLSVQFERLGSTEDAMAYMAQLDAQASTYTDSGTVPAHLVSSGRADVGVTFGPYCETERLLGADVRTIYPRDGTGFEVGSIAVLRESSAQEEATRFVSFTISDEGQLLGASAARQLPVSDRVDGNLNERLDALDADIFGSDIAEAADRRSDLISTWAEQVRKDAH